MPNSDGSAVDATSAKSRPQQPPPGLITKFENVAKLTLYRCKELQRISGGSRAGGPLGIVRGGFISVRPHSHFASQAVNRASCIHTGRTPIVCLLPTMRCPTCLLYRQRKYWRPSQWHGDDPVTDVYKQCKGCDGILPMREWWELPAAAAPPPVASSRSNTTPSSSSHQHDEATFANVPSNARILVLSCRKLDQTLFGAFVEQWMTLSYKDRKLFSYSGAVRSLPGDPTHYHCPDTGHGYFDPGNYIYSLVLDIMCPSLMATVDWNMCTNGDICESIMGCGYEWRAKHGHVHEASCTGVMGRGSQQMSHILNCFAWYTYHLYCDVGFEHVEAWVTWIINIVLWKRNEVPCGKCTVSAELGDTITVGVPRDKCYGGLISGCVPNVD